MNLLLDAVHWDRFWAKVDASGDCWEWLGGKTNGYAGFHINRQPIRAHRVAWANLVGPQTPGIELDHLCRNRACVNPDHMREVTKGANIRAGFGHSAINARKTHCKRGHPFDKRNTYITKEGWRQCRACAALKFHRLQAGIRIGKAGS